MAPTTTPPTMAATRAETGGMPEARAMPSDSGTAMMTTTKLAMRFARRFSEGEWSCVFFIIGGASNIGLKGATDLDLAQTSRRPPVAGSIGDQSLIATQSTDAWRVVFAALVASVIRDEMIR
jgi:hypothetical protein